MKKEVSRKVLKLTQETIRRLTSEELKNVVGGTQGGSGRGCRPTGDDAELANAL